MRDIINSNDEVIGQADKAEFGPTGLSCRVAFIMLSNKNGELLLHQRSANKKAYPLYWSGAAAGHLNAGESYEEAALRELKEELGVEVPLKLLGKFYSDPDREMVGVFIGTYDGPVKAEPWEVAQVEHFTPERLQAESSSMQITSYVERALPMVLSHLGSSSSS